MNFAAMSAPAIPGIAGPLVDRLWGASAGRWSFIISYIEGDGYHASWKNMEFVGKQSSNKIDGTPFQKFTDAENACKAALKQLRAPA